MSYEYDEQMDREYEATHKRFKIPYKVTLTFNLEVDIPDCCDYDIIPNAIDYEIGKLDLDKDIVKSCEYEFESGEWTSYEEVPLL